MATSTLTDTVRDPGGNVVATSSGTVVNFRLMANGSPTPGFRKSDGVNVASLIVTSASTTGTISQALENNSNIAPTGTYYVAEILCPSSQGGAQEWALLSSSSVSPQSFYDALAAPMPTFVPLTTVPTSILGGNNVFTGINQFNGNVYFRDGVPWADVGPPSGDQTGVTDTAAVVAALAALAASGGVVNFSLGVYYIDVTVTIATSAITMRGAGMVPGNPASKGTAIRWVGADLGTMFEVKNTSSSPYGVGFESMTIAAELQTGDLVDKAAVCVAYRAGYGHWMKNVNLWRAKGSATQGALTLGNDIGGSDPAVGTIQNFRSENLWITLYGNNDAVGILVNHSGTEICAFDTTFISAGANGAGQGNGTMLHAIWARLAPCNFDSLLTDTNGAQAADAAVFSDAAPIRIDGWTSEDSMPLRFSAGVRQRGSVISNAEMRSVDPAAGKWAIEMNGVAGLNATQSLTLEGVTMRRLSDAAVRPSIRVNNSVVTGSGTVVKETVTDAIMSTTDSTRLDSAVFGFEGSDVGSWVTVTGAGVAGATLSDKISAVASSSRATVVTGAATTVSGATLNLTRAEPVTRDVTNTGVYDESGVISAHTAGMRWSNTAALQTYLADNATPYDVAQVTGSNNVIYGVGSDVIGTVFIEGGTRFDLSFGAANIVAQRLAIPSGAGATALWVQLDSSTGPLRNLLVGSTTTGPAGVGRMAYLSS